MNDSILLDVSDGLARVTLNRPERLNAINDSAAYRWQEIAAEVTERGDVEAVLIDAHGSAFCAGGDVSAFAQLASQDASNSERIVTELADAIHSGHQLLRDSAKPIVAAVQGAVAGGGLGFMLVADYIVASERAIFISKYADIGLTPDCGVSTLLPEAVGMRRALELVLSDRTLSAADALGWGLVTEVVAASDVSNRALDVAELWLRGATAAYGQARRLLRSSPFRTYGESLADEARTIAAALVGGEAESRVIAFGERAERTA